MAGLAKLMSGAEDSSFRDAMIESIWVGFVGGIAGYAGGAVGDAAIGGLRNLPITVLQNIIGIALITASILGGFNNRLILRYGIPFGGAFITGADAYAAYASPQFAAVRAAIHNDVNAILARTS